MMNVMARGGVTLTSRLMNEEIRPTSSAMPTPIMATTMTPTTPKLLKLATGDVNTNRSPSASRRLCAATVTVIGSSAPICACSNVTVLPAAWKIAESTMMNAMRMRKMITGWGTLFPATSIPSRTFWRTDRGGATSTWLMRAPWLEPLRARR